MTLQAYMEKLLEIWDTDEKFDDGHSVVILNYSDENCGQHPQGYPLEESQILQPSFDLLSVEDRRTLVCCEGGLLVWRMNAEIKFSLESNYSVAESEYQALVQEAKELD
jgi:hypothetical protein